MTIYYNVLRVAFGTLQKLRIKLQWIIKVIIDYHYYAGLPESEKVAKSDTLGSKKEQIASRHVLELEDFLLKAMESISLKLG